MGVIAEAVKHMLAAGMAPEAVYEAVAAMEGIDAPARTARQERNARYYAKKVSEKRLNASYSDVSDDQDAPDVTSPNKRKGSTPPKENYPPQDLPSLPSEAQDTPKNAREQKRTQGRTLPEDWAPKAKHRAEAEALGRDDLWLDRQAESMRLWAVGNRNRAVARKADWDATFLGWIRREHEDHPPAQPRASPPWAPPDTKSALERAMAKAGIQS